MSTKAKNFFEFLAVLLTCLGVLVTVVWTARGYAKDVEATADIVKGHTEQIRTMEKLVYGIEGDVKAIRAIVEGKPSK